MRKIIKYFFIYAIVVSIASVVYVEIIASDEEKFKIDVRHEASKIKEAKTIEELNLIYSNLDSLQRLDTLDTYTAYFDSIRELRSIHEKRIISKKIESNKIAAYVMACEYLKKRLKVPSTANFQKYHRGVTVSYNTSAQVYKVRLYVDAQNSFGAMLRNRYQVSLSNPQKDSWLLMDIAKLN